MSRKVVRFALVTLSLAGLLAFAAPGSASPFPSGPLQDLTGWWHRLAGWTAGTPSAATGGQLVRRTAPGVEARPRPARRGPGTRDEGLGVDPNGKAVSPSGNH